MSKTTGLILGLNVLLAATLIGTISQSSASGTTASMSVTSACANLKTGVLRLPTSNDCAVSEKRVSFGPPSTPQNAVKAAYVRTQSITVLSSCPWSSFVTDVRYSSYSTYNPISVSKSQIYCRTVSVVVP